MVCLLRASCVSLALLFPFYAQSDTPKPPPSKGSAASHSPKSDNALAYVKSFLVHIANLNELKRHAAAEVAQHHASMNDCIRTSESFILELRSAASAMHSIRLEPGSLAKESPSLMANMFDQQQQTYQSISNICTQFAAGPKAGVDYGAIAAELPKLSAGLEFSEKTLFNGSPLVLGSIMSLRPDAKGHASHLTISKKEKDDLVRDIQMSFGETLTHKQQNYYLSIASVFESIIKNHKGYDEPWN